MTEITLLTRNSNRQQHTLWTWYYLHVVDIKSDYIANDRILEDAVDEMVTDHSSEDEQEFTDEDDR